MSQQQKSDEQTSDRAKEKEVARLRGEGRAYSVVGALGAGALAFLETFGADMLLWNVDLPKSKTGKAILLGTASAAVCALAYGAYKHSHADQIEETQRKEKEFQRQQEKKSWAVRVREDAIAHGTHR
ncbi:MAG: hypothetical protein SFX19_07080 [Alphaproteobacteria bacterium]|nr:hypothetical protein [Alphaproteobacteria bacterium]